MKKGTFLGGDLDEVGIMMHGMKILDPVLTPDVSIWCNHINPQEFEDGGCGSVVVGLYYVLDDKGKRVLSPISRQQCIDVATKSSMVLQAYFWDDIILDPADQAEWVAKTIQAEGLPIKWVWADQEQWWLDWSSWQQARGGKIPNSAVQAGTPANISSHYESFMRTLHNLIPTSGVYTNKGFISTWAKGMDSWLAKYRSWVPYYKKQPAQVTRLTWEQFKQNWMPDYDLILSEGQKPELVVGHQFMGSGCVLPGSYSKSGDMLSLDVSVFSKAFMDEIRGVAAPQPPATPPATTTPTNDAPQPSTPANDDSQPTTPTNNNPPPAGVDYVVLYERINVRSKPDSNSTWVRFALKDEVLHVVKVENDWAQLADGTYVFLGYIRKKVTDNPATPTNSPSVPNTFDYVVLYARVNVRARPDSNSTWVRFGLKDEVLHVVKIVNNWAQLADGTYVFAGYIKKV